MALARLPNSYRGSRSTTAGYSGGRDGDARAAHFMLREVQRDGYSWGVMAVLPFSRPTDPPPATTPPRIVRRARTHCEACGQPTVRHACPPAIGAVRLICLTCEHQWHMPERRAVPRFVVPGPVTLSVP
jgi:hypothetical protein